MIDTNALLAVTFSVIAQFHTIVNVPSRDIPLGPENIRRVVVGSPFSPFGVYLETLKGSSYEVIDGSIRRYETATSFMNLQDPQRLPEFLGPARVSSNEVFQLAVATIQRLTKQGKPKTDGSIKIETAGKGRGVQIPFYYVNWSLTNSVQGHAASVEIDARTGEITYMHLPDPCFRDYALAQQISNRVFTPAPPHVSPLGHPSHRVLPYPPTNEVEQVIVTLAEVCGRLGMSIGSQTNTSGVDWDRSYSITNSQLSGSVPVYQIRFTNGANTASFRGAIIGYQLPDAYGNIDAPPVDPKRFSGTVTKSWKDLAESFEAALKYHFGFSEDFFMNSKAVTAWGNADAPIGKETHIPIMVMWLPYVDPSAGNEAKRSVMQMAKQGPKFNVEFNLQTGEIKSFAFYHSNAVETFARNQRSWKSTIPR
ncbi:MAG TPA: hypothetical protein VFZ59_09180 [Verrucomicrobiae bacterium]|nr:hypothetical protein [Verrucomicrobiae bacterium]